MGTPLAPNTGTGLRLAKQFNTQRWKSLSTHSREQKQDKNQRRKREQLLQNQAQASMLMSRLIITITYVNNCMSLLIPPKLLIIGKELVYSLT